MILGRWPLRALNTSEVLDPDAVPEAQPQCVSCSNLNLRRRTFVQTKTPRVAATTVRAAICCQSMLEYTLSTPVRNCLFSLSCCLWHFRHREIITRTIMAQEFWPLSRRISASICCWAHDKVLPVEKRERRHRGVARPGRGPPPGGAQRLNLPQFGSIWFGMAWTSGFWVSQERRLWASWRLGGAG